MRPVGGRIVADLAAGAATGQHDNCGAAVQNMNLMLGLEETEGLNL